MKRTIAIALLVAGCASAQPLVMSALEAIGPAAVDALTRAVLDEYGDDAHLVMESAGCFPVSDVSAEALADLVGDDQQEFVYVACRVRVRR